MSRSLRHFGLYDGRERMGSVVEKYDGTCNASDHNGKKIGTFDDLKSAVAAIDDGYRKKTAGAVHAK
jgi:hypothetical protein